jgi:CspA family cold shock protein
LKPPSRNRPILVRHKERIIDMAIYGTTRSFSQKKGKGVILPEKGGQSLIFDRSSMKNHGRIPDDDQRSSYEMGNDTMGRPCAVNLEREPS